MKCFNCGIELNAEENLKIKCTDFVHSCNNLECLREKEKENKIQSILTPERLPEKIERLKEELKQLEYKQNNPVRNLNKGFVSGIVFKKRRNY